MENVEKNEVKVKKEIHPIWIFLVCMFLLSGFVAGFISGATGIEDIETVFEEHGALISFIVFATMFLPFSIMYFKRMKTDIKRLNKKTMILTLIMTVAMIAIGTIVLLTTGDPENQQAINEMFLNATIITIISTVIFAPFVEEVVFRSSLGSLIKNNILFIIVSSLLFGLVHQPAGLDLSLLLYTFMGVLFAITYIKTEKNLAAVTLMHLLNNVSAVIWMFIRL